MRSVRIYDFDTKTLTEIPESELAPGYVRATVVGVEGEVYIPVGEGKKSEYQHPPFDTETQKVFADFSEIFAEVLPMTVAQWEDGFRRDMHPEKEIEGWKRIAAAYLYFTEDKKMPDEARKDYFRIVLSCFNNGCSTALEVMELGRLSKARARGVVSEIREKFGF